MPLMTSGVYIGSDDRGYEAETSYYLNFQIISALASLAKIDSFNDSYGWENPCQYYHYYTDHLLFSIGQITNRFQVNNRDSEKEKERKTLNREHTVAQTQCCSLVRQIYFRNRGKLL